MKEPFVVRADARVVIKNERHVQLSAELLSRGVRVPKSDEVKVAALADVQRAGAEHRDSRDAAEGL